MLTLALAPLRVRIDRYSLLVTTQIQQDLLIARVGGPRGLREPILASFARPLAVENDLLLCLIRIDKDLKQAFAQVPIILAHHEVRLRGPTIVENLLLVLMAALWLSVAVAVALGHGEVLLSGRLAADAAELVL